MSKTEGFLRFLRFLNFLATLCGNPAVECQKLTVFLRFFLVGRTPLKENKGRVLKTGFFLRFWGSRKCPENCAHDSFCLIRPFFRERKNERKSPKNVKNWGFLAIFLCLKQPSAGIRLSNVKLGFFCDFGVPESVLTIRFASYGLLQTLFRGEKRWFQTSLKPV